MSPIPVPPSSASPCHSLLPTQSLSSYLSRTPCQQTTYRLTLAGCGNLWRRGENSRTTLYCAGACVLGSCGHGCSCDSPTQLLSPEPRDLACANSRVSGIPRLAVNCVSARRKSMRLRQPRRACYARLEVCGGRSLPYATAFGGHPGALPASIDRVIMISCSQRMEHPAC